MILPFPASCSGVVPGYCSASVSTETTLGPVTMVIGEDVSRWELYFQNLKSSCWGKCAGMRGGRKKGKGGRRSYSILTQESIAVLGTNHKA